MRSARRFAAVFSFLAAVPGVGAQEAADCSGVSPAEPSSLKSIVVVSGLVRNPLLVTAPPGDVNRQFVVEQSGFIRIHRRGDPAGTWSTYLDISARVDANSQEGGLLGLAFDPDYATNGQFFVNYTETATDGLFYSVIARYSVRPGNPQQADPASELRILRLRQPESNHNGGQLLFGRDRMLYAFFGDGGGANDNHGTCGNGQNRDTLLGKMLRLDVKGVDPNSRPPDCSAAPANNYRIPSDNPFAGKAGCEEIYSLGLRNPWRSAQDTLNGDWYLTDVGQNCWEEVNYAASGTAAARNYGWRVMEANHCFNTTQPGNCNPPGQFCGSSPSCQSQSLTEPVLEYDHNQGACSVTGGIVYRGCRMPSLRGTFFYGDYCAGFVRSFRMLQGTRIDDRDWTVQLDPNGLLQGGLTSFGSDGQGELYIVDRAGDVRLVLPSFKDLEVSGPGSAQPFLLSKSGWSWEDLQLATQHPVSQYRVYRSFAPIGTYDCIFRTTGTSYAGDLTRPDPGFGFYYLVLAVSPDGERTSTGSPPRNVSSTTCP